jgi:hypothetical protein
MKNEATHLDKLKFLDKNMEYFKDDLPSVITFRDNSFSDIT